MCRKSTSPVATNLYTSDGIKIRMDTLCQKSDELGGMAENLLGILEWRRENTVRLNCCFDSAINLLRVSFKSLTQEKEYR